MNHVIADDAPVPATIDQLIASDDEFPLSGQGKKNLEVLRLKPFREAIVRGFMGHRVDRCRTDPKLCFRAEIYSICRRDSIKHAPPPYD